MADLMTNETDEVIPREPPQVPEARKKLVKRWADRVRRAKQHWKPDFDRMRKDQDWAYGLQGLQDDQYQANLIQRHVAQRVAALYAKNPRALARRKERLDFALWDGRAASLQAALGAAQVAAQNGMEPPPDAVELLADIQNGTTRRKMLERLAKTLELVYAHAVEEQSLPFKQSMKQSVRRAVVCGAAYVKLGFQRVMEPSPETAARIADLSERLATMERIAADIADDELREDDAEAEQLRLSLQALEAEPEQLIREGLLFDFPATTAIIPDPRTKRLKGFVGAEWVAEEFLLSTEEVKEIFRVDVGSNYRGYTNAGNTDEPRPAPAPADDRGDGSKGDVLVWQVFCRKDGMVYWVADGYPDFLREPSNPDVKLERFWPYFVLTFNELEHEKKIFPPSDVTILRPLQREYNRAREGIREHRIANRPKTITGQGRLTDPDKEKLQDHPANAVIELQALTPGEKVEDLLQPYKGPPIDPNLYEVAFIFDDILKTVGSQEANFGGTSSSTATESSIAEGSRMSALSSAVDELDDMLTELARSAGQVLLSELSEETVRKIVGPGATWPELTREEIVSEVYLEVEAGSSGRPNKASELQNMQLIAPYLLQVPGLSPEWMLKELLRRLDDKLDVADAYAEGLPSIMALNAQKQIGTADPATDQAQQGSAGALNAPRAQEGSNRDPNAGPAPGAAGLPVGSS